MQDFVNKGKYRKCISSVQKANENSIEFSLSTQTRRVIKSSWAKSLQVHQPLDPSGQIPSRLANQDSESNHDHAI